LKLYTKSNKIETSIDVENSLSFGIADQSIIIDFLRNKIYSNKLKTPIQEIISNARDASRSAESNNRIDITIPSVDNNYLLKIRDFGSSITPESMKNVFVLYGESTKRGTNSQLGGFGVGAKSPFSYTNSFNVTTFINGTKRQYLALIDDSNKGRLDLTYEGETDEPDGTEISYVINQYDVNSAVNAVSDTTMFWSDEEYPTFTGPASALAQLKREREHFNIRFMGRNFNNIANTRVGHAVVVVDGIPYPHPSSSRFKTIFVPAGLLTFPITRESIENTPKNLKVLEEIEKEYIQQYIEAEREWQQGIVDVASMRDHYAVNKQCGFNLTSKMIHNLRIENGSLKFKYLDNENRFFEAVSTYEVLSDGEKYYLMPGSRYTKKQLNSITNKIEIVGKIQIEYETDFINPDGSIKKVVHHKWEYDEKFAAECIEIAKAHGFTKNLVEHVEKWKPEKRVIVQDKEIYYYTDRNHRRHLDNDPEDLTYYYYQGGEYDHEWDISVKGFELYSNRFDKDKVRLIRLTKKNLSKLKNDPRFIPVDKFFDDNAPTDFEVIMNLKSFYPFSEIISRHPKISALSILDGIQGTEYNLERFLAKNPNLRILRSEAEKLVNYLQSNTVNLNGPNRKMIEEFKNWYYAKLDPETLYAMIPNIIKAIETEETNKKEAI
jgi:hypothetical protein